MLKLLFVLILVGLPISAGSLRMTLTYSPSDVSVSRSGTYWTVSSEGMEPAGASGSPLLPASHQIFILPEGASNVTITSVPLDVVELVPSGLNVMPASVLRPLGSSDPQVRFEDPEIYESGSVWPGDAVIYSHTGYLSGIPVASCLIQPWQYRPVDGSLGLITELEIMVRWDEGTPPSLTPGQRSVALLRTAALRGEPSLMQQEMDRLLQGGDAQYLIVCDSSCRDVLLPLADYHREKGLTVEVADINEIISSTGGADDAEKLRNFIRDRYQNHGTVFVLLAGDETLIPVRYVFTYCEGYADTSPVDLYFADLDGSWDGNGDGNYGQPNDDLDLYADVILARALFSTPNEAETFVDKSLDYQQSPPPGEWTARAVLCGAVLFEEQGYTADKGCDSIAVEFPSYWEINRFYEELPGGGTSQHIPLIDGGSAWNHYAGHGTSNGIWWSEPPLAMMTSWIASDSLQNGDRVGIHTSIACHPAEYVGGECCAEALLHNPSGGAAAVMFNVSYGWEGHWPALGASELMCIDLARQVFRYHSPSLGIAFSTARDLRIPHMLGGYDRTFQSLLSFSAFMDPAMKVMNTLDPGTIPPVAFSISPPYPNPAERDAPISFNVDFQDGLAEVSVHDIAGRLLWRTVIGSSGRVSWSGVDQSGGRLPAGVYVVSARRGDYVVSRLTTILD